MRKPAYTREHTTWTLTHTCTDFLSHTQWRCGQWGITSEWLISFSNSLKQMALMRKAQFLMKTLFVNGSWKKWDFVAKLWTPTTNNITEVKRGEKSFFWHPSTNWEELYRFPLYPFSLFPFCYVLILNLHKLHSCLHLKMAGNACIFCDGHCSSKVACIHHH